MTTATPGPAAPPPRRPRFRYAPTPSRWLHVGNGLAALVGWGLARAARGAFVLRIEDIDRARCRPEFEDGTLRDLAWLGIDWDEGPDVGGPHGPYRQSARMGRYDALLAGLIAAHTAIQGGPGWLTPETWPGGMPPITLLGTLLALVVLAVTGRARRPATRAS